MPIVPAHTRSRLRRAPLTSATRARFARADAAANAVLGVGAHYDSSCESPPAVTPPSPTALFLSEYSTRKRLRDCIPGWACQYADCPSCGERAALKAQADVLAKFGSYPTCLSLRLSTETSIDLDTGHRDLSAVRTSFLEIARLSRTTAAYLRSTEVTRVGARWNWHDHLVIVPTDNTDSECRRLSNAWDEACRLNGLQPSSHAQTSDTDSAVTYVLKPRLGSGETSLRALLARAARGDADAAADWRAWDEWRRTHPRARFRYLWVGPTSTATGTPARAPRDQRLVSVDDADLNRLGLLSALGVTSKKAQANVLGMSESSVARRRRHVPTPRPGLAPFRRS